MAYFLILLLFNNEGRADKIPSYWSSDNYSINLFIYI